MRALELCLDCSNALEVITLDPVVIPGKCCRQEVECVHLNRHWPACKAGEDVFSEGSCSQLVAGSPAKVFPPLRIVALPGA